MPNLFSPDDSLHSRANALKPSVLARAAPLV
jgi:hypothetical protein